MLLPQTRGYFDIFDDFFSDPFFEISKGPKFNEVMRTDIKEKDGNYIMDIDLPGTNKEDINIELNEGYLTVSATTNKEVDDSNEKDGYIHKERYQGTYKRSYYAGKNIKEEDIKASYKNGTLTLVFPKEETKKLEQKKFISID
ncbi:MAG: Hsp20/alpha crystallin family protein [Clostridia bacterium]|nr:Hsp20/alpha crystallin family protein [Clostridia bacterium]